MVVNEMAMVEERQTPVKMTPWSETDELWTRFHTCYGCGFTRVPFWCEIEQDPADVYDATARFCPGCGHPVQWEP